MPEATAKEIQDIEDFLAEKPMLPREEIRELDL
jgi:hypothetical protein